MEGLEIVLKGEKIAEIAGLPITNTLLTGWIVAGVLILSAVVLGGSLKIIPSKVQLLFEMLVEYTMDYIEETLESGKLARRFFPLIMSLFLFIFFGNLFGLLPGIGSISVPGAHGPVDLFHPVNTDLNATLAYTIIVFVIIEAAGITALGVLKYGKRFVNLSSPLNFAVGVIELFSELARLISFSFRLFGNMFAGKVLILIATFFVPYILPVPLMLFEVFVGLIQAAIFALLTLFFIKIAVTPQEQH